MKNQIKIVFEKIPLIKYIKKRWNLKKSIKESLKCYHDVLDPKENKETTPPDSENIEYHCVWVTEIFTPSNINSLIKYINNLGWNENNINIDEKYNLIKWIQEGRRDGTRSSYMNGGVILSPLDSSKFPGSYKKYIKLPNGVDYCSLSLEHFTSSITLVTVQFVFNDKIATSLNETINTSYKTKIQNIKSYFDATSILYSRPAQQKRQSIRNRLQNIHDSIYTWFNKNLPGYFSSMDTNLPTISLITSSKYDLSIKEKDTFAKHYTDMLFEPAIEIWKGKGDCTAELRICRERHYNQSNKIATIFGKYGDLMKYIEKGFGDGREGLTNKLNMSLRRTISFWATHNLFMSWEKQLASIRDKKQSSLKDEKCALKELNQIRDKFLSLSTDVQVVAADIINWVSLKGIDSNIDFTPPVFYRNYSNFLEYLRLNIIERSKMLSNLESQVNKYINANSNLTSAITNLRIQRKIFWLTLSIVILTILSFWTQIKPILNDLFKLFIKLLQFCGVLKNCG